MGRKHRRNRIKRKKINMGIMLLLVLLVVAVILVMSMLKKNSAVNEQMDVSTETDVATEANGSPEDLMNLGNELFVAEVGNYSGKYVEDGSDENVSDVLMMKILNRGEEAIEYAVIELQVGEKSAEFSVSALMPGAEAILLEKNRMPYDAETDYTKAAVNCLNFARYQYDLTLQKEKLNIQILDGGVNVTNISEEDIAEDITIYYKNKEDEVFLGGITYRISFEGGIKSGEIRQKMANHLSKNESEILFVTMTK